ncbi:MAG: Rnf-Nqr domain containing protein [Oscillospiraceae bacterium]
MSHFVDVAVMFFKDMFLYAMIAIFLENTIFSRAIGTSTSFLAVRQKFNIFLFGLIMTIIIGVSSIITYFLNPFISNLKNSYYIIPTIYVAIIGIVYILALLFVGKFMKKRKTEILRMIHISTFNCAVLGALLLAGNISELSFGGYMGFTLGSGIGFTFATFFVDVAYERLSSKHVPNAFRGFPITLVYLGIVCLGIYGLIGHELPF